MPPPPSAKPPITRTFCEFQQTIIPTIPACDHELGMADLLDIALQNSPKTRGSWFRAKSAAADVGIARGAYLPPVNFTAEYLNSRLLFQDEWDCACCERQIFYGPAFTTSFLLWDFGGRNGNLKQAVHALEALNWTYNWSVQTVMIQVIQDYYTYLNAVAIVQADEATVIDNEKTLEAISTLKSMGVHNLADELQARTLLLQSQLTLAQDRGIQHIALAHLLHSLGLPADTPLCVGELPLTLGIDFACEGVSSILYAAKSKRSDLMALRSRVLESRARIQTAKSTFFPTINTEILGGKQWINHKGPGSVYALSLNLNLPLFNSFADANSLQKAQAEWQEAQALLDEEELSVFSMVMTDYYTFLASTDVLHYSMEFIEIAEKNREVAFANYVAGVNTIIELMTANNALHGARKQLANARTAWLTSIANLTYNTGGLTVDSLQPSQSLESFTIENCREVIHE